MKRMILILMIALGALSGCVVSAPPAPSAAPGNAIETAVVQTLTAMPTSNLASFPTAVPATATALPVAATAIPPSPTPTALLPSPTATLAPTAASSGGGGYYAPVTENPSAFIRYYYGQINLGNYPLTWSLLDANFINNNNGPATGGYAGYVNFWSTVHEVIVQSVYVDSTSACPYCWGYTSPTDQGWLESCSCPESGSKIGTWH